MLRLLPSAVQKLRGWGVNIHSLISRNDNTIAISIAVTYHADVSECPELDGYATNQLCYS
jgi:hypothetical protein